MKIKAGIAGLGLFAWALTAQAQTSAYSSMAVPGTHNDWSTTPTMKLVADYTWVCTQTFSSASGLFKFAANGAWDRELGRQRDPDPRARAGIRSGSQWRKYIVRGLQQRPVSHHIQRIHQAIYRGMGRRPPPPPPTYTNIALVGDFNGWTWGKTC